mmetsp:Transcript_6346/g.7852  ORF Transcript_6346/g.7852 Transcript_6346/m.7852 type:complete len:316 (-) Transcript_6346:102-1049(-)
MLTIPFKDSTDDDDDEVTMESFESNLLNAANNSSKEKKKKTKTKRIITKSTTNSMLLTVVTIAILLFLQLLKNIPTTNAMGVGAYVYYQDAECITKNSKSVIHGTFVYAYDNSRMSGKGFVKENYYGPCKYFDGGYYDFMYQQGVVSSKNYMKTGYCITCHDMVGCSKSPNNCTEFQSMVPTNAYTLSSSSSSSSLSGYEEFADEVEYGVYQEMMAVSTSFADESVFIFGFLGMMIGFTTLMVLYAGMVGIKKMRRNKASKNIFIDKTEFLDRRDDDNHDNVNGRGNINDSRDRDNDDGVDDDATDIRINVGTIA